ncbi:MAG: hypothetical protein L3J54_14885 [Draconibacterium sp.]|nr:hypothetical protein [Draconibacterium sp.]
MNKTTLLLILVSQSVFSAGEEGTGAAPESSSDGTNYQLVCTTNTDSAQQDNNQDCILVPVTTGD